MFKLHKWSRPRSKAHRDVPICTVCNLQAASYNYSIGKASTWVIDSGEVWGSHVAIRYPRARLLGDCEYETISFDHDLGGEDTGIKVLNWMAWDCPDLRWPKKIMIHSYNPVGAQNLYNVATRYAPAGTLIQRVSFA